MILARRSASVIGARISPGDTPVQQIKGAGLSGRGQSTQGLPKPLKNVSTAIIRSGANRTLRVTFQQDPSDPYFVTAHVYVQYANNANPVLVASGTSPVTVTLAKTNVPAVVSVVGSGNWGAQPLETAEAKAVSLA